jgi:phosphohistidine swiveling domain-containing protein
MKYVIDINQRRLPASIGNKAANLHKLASLGARIPRTHAINWSAYDRYISDDINLIEELQRELAVIIEPGKEYAVRSSANLEDSLDRSFAGQFKSVLHVRGVDNVIQAAWSVWSSAQTPAVTTYLDRHNIPSRALSMAVIVQEMVKPVYSGVALSRNPVTGADEIVVEAIQGDGAQLVQGGLTPDRWVNKWGYWVEQATGSDIPLTLIEEVIAGTKSIAEKLRHSVDLEWVYDGSHLHWVQVRQISTLSPRNVYSNYIPREVMPGMIKPLIFSVNVPLVNGVWIRWISEITGDLGLKPHDLTKSFYYRAYFNMGALGSIFEGLGFPRESVEMLMGLLPRGAARPSFKPGIKTFSRLPWMLSFIWRKWNFGPTMRRALAKLESRIRATPYTGLESQSESTLLASIDRHYALVQELAYYNVLGPLLMGMYNSALKSRLAKLGVDFNNFDLTEGMPEIAEYDPTTTLRRLHAEFRALSPLQQKKICDSSYIAIQQSSDLGDFPKKIADFIERFGHLSDNGNDFSAVPWRENPDMVQRLITDFEPGKEDGHKVRLSDLRARGQARYPLMFLYHRAREFRLLRERVSGLYTHGYGLFRYYYLALGAHFTRRGCIGQPEDIFYMTNEQVHALVEGRSMEDLRSQIAHHRSEIERFQDIQLPTVIYGDEMPPVREPNMDVLAGIPTSIGHYTGRVKVVKGIQDFSKVMKGDVLVVPYSDVGWTPLFARAGAVVAESGGLLSHSSIVAREYNIPAVVSVEGATRLPDNTLVTVDGHKGEILVHAK